MGRYDDDDDFDDLPLPQSRFGHDRPHSRLGLVSLGIALFGGTCTAAVIVAAVAIDSMQPVADEELWAALAMLVLLCGGGMTIAGIVAGVVGSVQSDRNPIFAILGAIANGLVLLAMLAAVCTGVLSGM